MNIRHRVHHIRQRNPTCCWHSSMQMVLGARGVRPLGSSEFAPFLMGNGTLNPSNANLRNFAERFRFTLHPHRTYTVAELQSLIRSSPVIVLGNWYLGLHAYVLSGMSGNGTPNGTELYINNPSDSSQNHFNYGFFIETYQRGPFGILKPRVGRVSRA